MDSRDNAPVFLNNDDIVNELVLDDEDLPDQDGGEDDDQPFDSDGDGDAPDGDPRNFNAREGAILDGEDDSEHVFLGHTEPVYTVACSPKDPTLVATGGGDGVCFLWRIGEATSPIELKGHSDSVAAVAFSSDGQLVATGGMDAVLHIWDAASGELKHRLDGPGEAIVWVKWHPRGHLVLAGSEDFLGWMWNADSGNLMKTFSGHAGSLNCGEFTPDGRAFCTGSADGSLRIWNPKSGATSYVIQGHPYHVQGLTCMAIHSDSTLAITGSEDNSVCVVNLQTGKIPGLLSGHTKSVESAGLSSIMPLAATCAMDGQLIIWDLSGLAVRTTCEHEDGVIKLVWPPSSHLIYTASLDDKVRAWDSRTGALLKVFHGHVNALRDLAMSSDGKYLVSVSDDCTARAFDIRELQ